MDTYAAGRIKRIVTGNVVERKSRSDAPDYLQSGEATSRAMIDIPQVQMEQWEGNRENLKCESETAAGQKMQQDSDWGNKK